MIGCSIKTIDNLYTLKVNSENGRRRPQEMTRIVEICTDIYCARSAVLLRQEDSDLHGQSNGEITLSGYESSLSFYVVSRKQYSNAILTESVKYSLFCTFDSYCCIE